MGDEVVLFNDNLEKIEKGILDTTQLTDGLTHRILNDASAYYYLYRKVSWVRSCVDVISRAAVSTGHSIGPKRRNETFNAIEFYNSDKVKALEYLLDNINPSYDISYFEELTIMAMLINGTSYARVLKKYGTGNIPVGLEYIDFRTIAPMFDSNGKIIKYKQIVNNDFLKVKYYSTDEIILFKRPNPGNSNMGLSPLESLDLPVATDVSAQKFNEAFFRNNAQAGMVFSGEDLSETDVERNKQWISQEYSKPENAHKPMFLLGKIKLISEGKKSPTDMSFIELRQFNREEIACVYGVPLTKLGITEKSNRSNTEGNDDTFLQETVEPIQKIFWDTFNREFLRKKFKIEDIVVSYGQREKVNIQRTTIANKMVQSGASGNEARAVMGLPAKDGYDTPLFLKSVVPGINDEQNEKLIENQINPPEPEPVEGDGGEDGELNDSSKQASASKNRQKKPTQTSKE